MECLDADSLAELFAPGSALRTRGAVEAHLDGCTRCRGLVAAYARASDDSGDNDLLAHTQCASTLASAPADLPPAEFHRGDVLGDRYELDRVVGEGGMGVVWAARDRACDRPVALKMLKNASPELTQRSWREARAAAWVGHPSLVEVLDVIASPGHGAPILVMPLLDGESLDALLARRGVLPAREAVALLEPVVAGMHAAHVRGVIHRDLKPSNVFFARDAGGPPVALVLDFGLSKLLSPDGTDDGADKLTRTGALIGTPSYMAPEQLFGETRVDGRADVWAIGAMLFECISGRRPIEGRSYAQIVRNAARGVILSLADAAPHAPAEVIALVSAMLAPERDARPDLDIVHARMMALASACMQP